MYTKRRIEWGRPRGGIKWGFRGVNGMNRVIVRKTCDICIFKFFCFVLFFCLYDSAFLF